MPEQPKAGGSEEAQAGGAQRLTVPQAAQALGVTRARVNQYVASGKLPAIKIPVPTGFYYVIEPQDLDRVRDLKPGRPPGTRKATDGG